MKVIRAKDLLVGDVIVNRASGISVVTLTSFNCGGNLFDFMDNAPLRVTSVDVDVVRVDGCRAVEMVKFCVVGKQTDRIIVYRNIYPNDRLDIA